MKTFFKEFKEFIAKGNVVDLAVAVIIGGAFSAIVTALTDKVIMPLVNWILALLGGGKNGLESAYTILSAKYTTDASGNQVLDLASSIYIDWGAFIAAIFNFLIIAMTLFILVRAVNRSKQRMEKFNGNIRSRAEEVRKKIDARLKKIKGKKNKKTEEQVIAEVLAEEPAEVAAEVAVEVATEQQAQPAQPAPAPANTTESMKDTTNIEMIALLREIRDALNNK